MSKAKDDYERVCIEFVGAMTDNGIYLLEQNPCGPGEVAAAIKRLAYERNLMAMMAADTPQFDNPMAAMRAKAMRDEILKRIGR